MEKPNGLDRNCLQSQLETYQLIVEVNSELVDENLSTKEELAKKIKLAQGCINESYQWEELGDLAKSHEALSNANMMIVKVGNVIQHLLYQDSFLEDGNLRPGQISG